MLDHHPTRSTLRHPSERRATHDLSHHDPGGARADRQRRSTGDWRRVGRSVQGPLVGLRVLDLATMIAAPFARRAAGRPRRRGHQGRVARARRHAARRQSLLGGPLALLVRPRPATRSRSRSTCATPRGRDLLLKLVARSDVVTRELPPRHPRALGPRLRRAEGGEPGRRVGARSRATARPGHTATRPASEPRPTAISRPDLHHRLAGPSADRTARSPSPTTWPACSAALSALAALRDRDVRAQGGQWVDVSLYESVFRLLEVYRRRVRQARQRPRAARAPDRASRRPSGRSRTATVSYMVLSGLQRADLAPLLHGHRAAGPARRSALPVERRARHQHRRA